jgi:beta-galactosidase
MKLRRAAVAAFIAVAISLLPAAGDATLKLVALVRDPAGNEVARTEREGLVRAGQMNVSLDLPVISHPELWSPRSPRLYTAEARLMKPDGTLLHSSSDHFGYRWFEFKPHGAFYLNGERLLIRGSQRHEEHAGYGGAVPDSIQRADLAAAKAMGANFLRLAHSPGQIAIWLLVYPLSTLVLPISRKWSVRYQIGVA